MQPIISVSDLTKTYASGFEALKGVNLEIRKGEIFALLGPNGAGKTTLISIICGIVTPTAGTVTVDGHDIVTDYRAARSLIGLVPQELTTDMFETVWATVQLQPRPVRQMGRSGLHREGAARTCRCGTSKDSKIMTLSGGMKRRVLIAKALVARAAHPLSRRADGGRRCRAAQGHVAGGARSLRASGVTIILTTHYIEEAEDMADRDRRDQQRRADPGRGQGRADAQARQEAADAAAA